MHNITNILQEDSQKSPIFHKHASAIIRNNKICYGTGYNHYRTIVGKQIKGTIHAEEDAIRNVVKSYLKTDYCVLRGPKEIGPD